MGLAAIAAAPGDAVAHALRARQNLSEEELVRLAASRARALAWHDDVDHRRELASALAALAPRRAEPARYYLESMEQTRAALLAAPASPHDWLRLAGLGLASSGHQARARAASDFSTALLTGADTPGLRPGVLQVGFRLWSSLPGSAKSMLLDVMRHAWRDGGTMERRGILALADANGLLELALMALREEEGIEPYLGGRLS
ncbi:hypothetical protein [Emcibacter sp. SYSU 3D8]|uniref:hypothetical protein n=1 Tax=Emcibacter sp. SYSU 3D8 TaxID=3133969 RepID=UPI0031FF26CD